MIITHKGRITAIGDTVNVSKNPGRTWNKRTFVVDDSVIGSERKNPVEFSLNQEDCGLVDGFRVGQEVEVAFFLNGREWKDPKTGRIRYFTELRVKRISKAGATTEVPPPATPPASSEPDLSVDDMPF